VRQCVPLTYFPGEWYTIIMYKIIAILALAATVLYVSYPLGSAAAASTEIASCCYVSVENKETPNTGLCCTGIDSDCCIDEYPVQDETFSLTVLFGKSIHRNDMYNLQEYLSGNSFAELSGIGDGERLHPVEITYFVFKPPKV